MRSKDISIKIIIILTMSFLIFSIFITSNVQDLTGEEIINKVNELINQAEEEHPLKQGLKHLTCGSLKTYKFSPQSQAKFHSKRQTFF